MACSTGNQNFLVSVGKAMAFDTTCGGKQLAFVADTLINSTISQAVQNSQVYGGPGSRLLFEYDYQKEISVTLEDAAFSSTYLALSNGTKLANAESLVYKRETIKFEADGTATLKGVPVGEVQVSLEDGTFTNTLAVGNVVTFATLAGKEAQVVYQALANTKSMTIDSSTFPQALELVISVDIFDSNNKKVEEMQIIIPKFKMDGNFELSLTHDGVATASITGKAFDSCGKYAEIHFIPNADGSAVCEMTGLVVTPNPIQLDSTVTGDSATLLIRPQFSDGSLGAPVTATLATTDDTIISVAGNVVTKLDTAVAGETAQVAVTYGTVAPVNVPVEIM